MSELDVVSRIMQDAILPREAPRVEGYHVAAGTAREEAGRGGSVWDWFPFRDGRTALLTLDVRQDGLPAAHHLGLARVVLRAAAGTHSSVPDLLAMANETLVSSSVGAVHQFVEVGLLVVGPEEVEWASAGRVPGGVIRRDGMFAELGAHGPPLGMMGGFRYTVQHVRMGAGDTAFVLSHGSHGLFLGAADLVAQLHGKPAGEIVSTLHRGIRRAMGEDGAESSVLYAMRH
ncbi:MAG: SpoIIE family protein phosphatase [Gemmatimonadota bacterium]